VAVRGGRLLPALVVVLRGAVLVVVVLVVVVVVGTSEACGVDMGITLHTDPCLPPWHYTAHSYAVTYIHLPIHAVLLALPSIHPPSHERPHPSMPRGP
jgi:hypothetical protein